MHGKQWIPVVFLKEGRFSWKSEKRMGIYYGGLLGLYTEMDFHESGEPAWKYHHDSADNDSYMFFSEKGCVQHL